jgi:hypothetical protein
MTQAIPAQPGRGPNVAGATSCCTGGDPDHFTGSYSGYYPSRGSE